jgi:hypothetical protein
MKNEEVIKELEKKRIQIIKEFEVNITAITSTIKMLKNDCEQEQDKKDTVASQLPLFQDNSELLNLKGKLFTDTIINIINFKNRFLHNSEITEIMIKLYIGRDRVKFSRQISGLLSKLKRENKICSYSDSNSQKDIYWGFEKWLVDGKIMEDNEYLKK